MTETVAQAVPATKAELGPVRGKDRIEVLDILRGIAILGIFFMNIPFMAGPIAAVFGDVRGMGWSGADQATWTFIHTTLDGTQRGLLEFLFGAGLMVTAAKAMEPDGPVAVADLYIRRNLWLLAFGLFDIFGLLWVGDILHTYALCALALFPFRKLRPRWLIALGLSFALLNIVGSGFAYAERSQLLETAQVAKAKPEKARSAEENKALTDLQKLEREIAGQDAETKKMAAEETKARSGSMLDYAKFMWGSWLFLLSQGDQFFWVLEGFATMLLGIALWKLGFIQGRHSAREYLVTMLVAYALGMGARYFAAAEQLAFSPQPQIGWFFHEPARLAVSLGHVAAINLMVKAAAGRSFLAPLKAAGQMAFTLYFLEQIIGIWIMFSPIGLHLPGAQGWAHLALQAGVVIAILLILANVWMRYFVSGPFEWLWRSLAYNRRQPFRRIPPAAAKPLPG